MTLGGVATDFPLKHYQRETLLRLETYLRCVRTDGARAAFAALTNTPYTPAPFVDADMPYVCLRVPTGGGKTIIAAHAVGVAAREHLQTDAPMVLWLVPSTAILDQTLTALRTLTHPYRAALAASFGRNVTVLTLAEALSLSRPDAEGGACVIVATMQAFRVEDREGRKVYEDSGALMDHFSGLTPAQMARLEAAPGGERPLASLCNLLRKHRPMVIVDEAHNARTPMSFQTLARLEPSMVLELTATPELEKGEAPSNVLYHVSAAELKAEEMIKLPVRLQTDADWKKVVGQALDCQDYLEKWAQAEEAATGEYIRPIVLIGAQSKSKTDPDRLTPERVVQFLTDDKRIDRTQIAIHGAGKAELDDVADIAARDCPIRYVVTVNKLREGWDCPFAYVLCSVAQLTSKTAVEQLLGRVLRMPRARRKSNDALNRAYAFVASADFQATAESLKDGLVEGAGFNKLEVAELVKPHTELPFPEARSDYVHRSDAFAEDAAPMVEAAIRELPPALRARISFDPATRSLGVVQPLSMQDRHLMHFALRKAPGAERVIDRLYKTSNNIPILETEGEKPVFIVPQLGLLRGGRLELFTTEHFLSLPWNLAACDPAPFVERFVIRTDSDVGFIDVEKGRMQIAFTGALHEQTAMAIIEPAWTLPRLVNWIDRGIEHRDVTKPAAKIFIQNALDMLMKSRGYSLDLLARYKYELRRGLAAEIDRLRKDREVGQYDALFAANAADFRTSADLALVFDEQRYAYNQPYRGDTVFKKHYFPIVGDLKADGEEFHCAVFLDRHNAVRTWVRNVDRKPNAFWLQTPSQKFYPDFVALLHDGRVLVVEYKGADRMEGARDKRRIGDLWAEASDDQCVFVMPTNRDFSVIDRAIN